MSNGTSKVTITTKQIETQIDKTENQTCSIRRLGDSSTLDIMTRKGEAFQNFRHAFV
jgi:hypothetical protein